LKYQGFGQLINNLVINNFASIIKFEALKKVMMYKSFIQKMKVGVNTNNTINDKIVFFNYEKNYITLD